MKGIQVVCDAPGHIAARRIWPLHVGEFVVIKCDLHAAVRFRTRRARWAAIVDHARRHGIDEIRLDQLPRTVAPPARVEVLQ